MEKFDGYDEIKIMEGSKAIVPGGYICKIIGAKVEEYASCSILKVAIDIAEGEYQDVFKKRFESEKASNPAVKWKGIFDVFIPKNDGSEKDGYTKQNFKRFITSVEKSNNYKWTWDESTLKGKLFGGVFGREEFTTDDGESKFACKCRFANSTDSIKTGNYKTPADKLLKTAGKATTAAIDSLDDFVEILSDGDVPF